MNNNINEVIYTRYEQQFFIRVNDRFFIKNKIKWEWKEVSIRNYPMVVFNHWTITPYPEIYLKALKQLSLLDD